MKILYMVNVPSPYMVNYFNELGKYCELTVLFDKATSTERDDSWKEYNFKNFKGIILKGVSTDVDAAFCPSVIKYLKKDVYDYIFISNMATPTGIIAIEYLRWKKIDYFLESEGGFAKDGKGFKEKIKKHIMSGAKLYFSTTPVGDEYFLMYGATKDKLVKYPFTSIYEKDILKKAPSVEEKMVLRHELKMQEEKIIISVGRFIPLKGFDVLLRAFSGLDNNAGLYIVGGEKPTDEYVQIINELKIKNVHFIPFKLTEELNKYYEASDIFVLPTRSDVWGLVINEAMAKGLPIITTDHCIAGTEMIDGNGYVIPVNDEKILHKKMKELLLDDDKRNEMSEKSLSRIHEYTFEKMAKVHMDFLTNYSTNRSR
jgi:glycosyltransferase involved in cell wall biosynthesis